MQAGEKKTMYKYSSSNRKRKGGRGNQPNKQYSQFHGFFLSHEYHHRYDFYHHYYHSDEQIYRYIYVLYYYIVIIVIIDNNQRPTIFLFALFFLQNTIQKYYFILHTY